MMRKHLPCRRKRTLVLVLAVFLSAPCQPFNISAFSPISTTNGGGALKNPLRISSRSPSRTPTARRIAPSTKNRLHMFHSLTKNQGNNLGASKRSSNQIREEDLDWLCNVQLGTQPPLPHSIDLSTDPCNGDEAATTRLVVRYLEDEDITKVLPEVVREFGALTSPRAAIPDSGGKLSDKFENYLTSPPISGDELSDKIENYLFSLTVLIGLTQRVVRRQKGYSPRNPARPDHNVICLVEQTSDGVNPSEQIVGMAELSWQPPDPNRNAPPFVLPYFVKSLISRFSSASSDGDPAPPRTPVGYVSNVLVWKTRRGRGYARVLMAALEGIARSWGCDDVRLHVDANESSGRIARGLYWKLGYEGVPDRGTSKDTQLGYNWMGPNMANQGLYLVDGVPLLYLRKRLTDD